jgi:hypothetical protein
MHSYLHKNFILVKSGCYTPPAASLVLNDRIGKKEPGLSNLEWTAKIRSQDTPSF